MKGIGWPRELLMRKSRPLLVCWRHGRQALDNMDNLVIGRLGIRQESDWCIHECMHGIINWETRTHIDPSFSHLTSRSILPSLPHHRAYVHLSVPKVIKELRVMTKPDVLLPPIMLACGENHSAAFLIEAIDETPRAKVGYLCMFVCILIYSMLARIRSPFSSFGF